MCGRYTLTKLQTILQQFPDILNIAELPPRFNIAPTQPVAAVANDHSDRLEMFHWGLVPSWAKDPSIGSRMINARAETLAEKPSFRTALKRRRCLIPADGFYEWKRNPDKTKTPMYIRLKRGEPFSFAGLWEVWQKADGSELPSCTIITTEPNSLMESIHDRMPVILPPSKHAEWLASDEQDPGRMQTLLRPYPAKDMEAFAVSRQVNSPANDNASLVEPVDPETLF